MDNIGQIVRDTVWVSLPEFIRLVFAAVGGGLIGAYIADKFTRKREKDSGMDSRKRNFLAFMESWKYEIGRTYLVVGGFEYKESSFSDVVATFKAEASNIRPDFPASKRKEFDDLCLAVVGGKHRSIYGTELCEKAQKDMDNLIAFVEKNMG